MLLFILRHAEAEDAAPGQSDASRRLTGKGRKQAERVGRFIRGLKEQPEAVLTSPLVRAVETARIVADEAKLNDPVIEPFLACGMTPETAREGLHPWRQSPAVLITGHQPDLGALANWLLGVSEGPGVQMKKGALCILEVSRFTPGGAALRFHAPPAMLPAPGAD